MTIIERANIALDHYHTLNKKEYWGSEFRTAYKIERLLEKREVFFAQKEELDHPLLLINPLEVSCQDVLFRILNDRALACGVSDLISFLQASSEIKLLDRKITKLVCVNEESVLVEAKIAGVAHEYIKTEHRYSFAHVVKIAKLLKTFDFNLKAMTEYLIDEKIKMLDVRLNQVLESDDF
jgi:hypothetical protein